jgi:hypothetical protein
MIWTGWLALFVERTPLSVTDFVYATDCALAVSVSVTATAVAAAARAAPAITATARILFTD